MLFPLMIQVAVGVNISFVYGSVRMKWNQEIKWFIELRKKYCFNNCHASQIKSNTLVRQRLLWPCTDQFLFILIHKPNKPLLLLHLSWVWI